MKQLFLIGIMAMMYTTSVAQCDDLITYEMDKVSQKGNWMMKENIALLEEGATEGIGISLLLSSDLHTVIWVNKIVGAGCVDDNAKVEILFTDKSNITILCNNSFNCDAKATLYFGGLFGKIHVLEELTTKYIETLRIWTSRSYVQKDFTAADQEKFKDALTCISNHRN